jgi:hypothetical protein
MDGKKVKIKLKGYKMDNKLNQFQVILLDSEYFFINSIEWKRAVTLMVKGKVEVVKESKNKIGDFVLPLVLRLFKSLSYLLGKKMRWSRENIYERDNFTCQYCSTKLAKHSVTIDHIVPQCRGGKNTWDNTVCACKRCNHEKGDAAQEDFHRSLIRKPKAPTVGEYFRSRLENIGFDLPRELGWV